MTTLTRGIPVSVHGAIEAFAGPAVMVAPFVFDFGQLTTVVAVTFGALLLTIAFQTETPNRTLPLSALAGFEYVLAMALIAIGIGIGLAGFTAGESVFLVGVGAAQVALTAATRFSAPRGA
jgi:hypothetical protein